jgi:RHS repeat-associated protein
MRRTVHGLMLLLIGIAIAAPAWAQGTETVVYFHTDAMGSVRMITDANGQVVDRYDYLPFGEPWPATPAEPEVRRFIGQELDAETALNHFGAREYLPPTGRFTRADDPGYGNPFDPQSMNMYAYAYNNPLRFIDPSGHEGQIICSNFPDTAAAPCDPGLLQFFLDAFQRPWEQHVVPAVERVRQVVVAPRDPACMSQVIGAYGAIGGMAGAYIGGTGGGVAGFAGGSLALPGGGSLAGGFGGAAAGSALGSAAGALGGAAVGSAVGSLACMSNTGGGGGGGGSYKSPKPGVSGKEGAKDVPSWAKGQRPRLGESGKDFAKRLLDGKYGPGNYTKGPGSEFNRIQKWGDRAFQ